jgi:carbon starvation protein
MFEAIFILTTLDAGTRVARFMLEDLLKFRERNWHKSKLAPLFSSAIIVFAWGYFLYLGVLDPNGGVNILWPLFGMSNQMLAGIALTFACVFLFKNRQRKFFLIAAAPLVFVLTCVTSAVLTKVFSSEIRIGFFAMANSLELQLQAGEVAAEKIDLTKNMIFNHRLLGFIALSFLTVLWIVVFEAVRKILRLRKES